MNEAFAVTKYGGQIVIASLFGSVPIPTISPGYSDLISPRIPR